MLPEKSLQTTMIEITKITENFSGFSLATKKWLQFSVICLLKFPTTTEIFFKGAADK